MLPKSVTARCAGETSGRNLDRCTICLPSRFDSIGIEADSQSHRHSRSRRHRWGDARAAWPCTAGQMEMERSNYRMCAHSTDLQIGANWPAPISGVRDIMSQTLCSPVLSDGHRMTRSQPPAMSKQQQQCSIRLGHNGQKWQQQQQQANRTSITCDKQKTT